MAARSPIVLDSSSPNRFRPPTISPQVTRQKPSIDDSSSPLASPSSFLRPLAKGLTSGSRAQQIPQNATTGFASAASLLRASTNETKKDEEKDDLTSADFPAEYKEAALRRPSGKLTKPSKKKEPAAVPSKGALPLRSPLQDYAYQDYKVQKDRHTLAAPQSPSLGNDEESQVKRKYRQPSRSLSEFDFPGNGETTVSIQDVPVGKTTKKQGAKARKVTADAPAKKPRKRAANESTESVPPLPPKRAKKKFSKSESIILDSDEPDPQSADANPAAQLVAPSAVVANKPTGEIVGDSTYFTGTGGEPHLQQIDQASPQPDDAGNSSHAAQPAARRRLSWTPVRNKAEQRGLTDSVFDQPEAEDTAKASFADILSGLAYSKQNLDEVPEPRAIPVIKRRKIELADPSVLPPAPQNLARPPKADAPKKVKAVKKKPQTITDLATKAYRPEEVETPQQTVSAFFTADNKAPEASRLTDEADPTTKTKKPRKPRVRKADGVPKAPKVTKTPKVTKPKANSNALLAKLLSPGAARDEERNQGFLFGTSSQLAVEDSPGFIRQMQVAMHDSEMMTTALAFGSPSRKSRTRVLSAPDGTNLSIGQAYLNHWCQAARDSNDDLLNEPINHKGWHTADGPLPFTRQGSCLESESRRLPDAKDLPDLDAAAQAKHVSRGENQQSVAQQHDVEARTVVDLCISSPAVDSAAKETIDHATGPIEGLDDKAQSPLEKHVTGAQTPADSVSNDSWMLLSSDDPPLTAVKVDQKRLSTAVPHPAEPTRKVPHLARAATSPSFSRHALQALDANASLLSRTSPVKPSSYAQHRLLATRASPEKQQAHQREQQSNPDTSASKPITAKKRGRPPGKKVSANAALDVPHDIKDSVVGFSASQPTTSAEWLHIDEISDSDTPATPSPPRRRATSTPPTVKALELETIASPSSKAKAPAAVTASLNIKASDDTWPALMAELFPRITAMVRSTPPSTDMAKPTWHEKILLYDPIILEDLTAWLNSQGVRLEMQRLKLKTKAKGRKKKDAPPDLPEYESVKEELKPWMVQKWCEDRSICCLWKEGLNGARRNRY